MKKLIIALNLTILVLVLSACSIGTVDGRTAEGWRDLYYNADYESTQCRNELVQYQDALEQANNNIDDAKGYKWNDYEDMGYALDSLDTVEP